jgi:hypothetical protein
MHFGMAPGRLVAAALLGTCITYAFSAFVACLMTYFASRFDYPWSYWRPVPRLIDGMRLELLWRGHWSGVTSHRSWVAIGALPGLLLPGLFVLLPATIRRVRVRWWHLLRIGMWWVVTVPPVLLTCLAVPFVAAVVPSMLEAWFAFQEPAVSPMAHGHWVTVGGLLAWTSFWWMAACRWYLRLPHARAVVVLLLAIGVMIAILLMLPHPSTRTNLIYPTMNSRGFYSY